LNQDSRSTFYFTHQKLPSWRRSKLSSWRQSTLSNHTITFLALLQPFLSSLTLPKRRKLGKGHHWRPTEVMRQSWMLYARRWPLQSTISSKSSLMMKMIPQTHP
ncbi:hypothetical protein PAXRUDRAFT_808096, partial [Paxillus rubicundulus Ve08.2h10]